MEPRFVTLAQVIALHKRSIERYGGTLGIRDPGGLEGAVYQPHNVYHYGGGDLFDIAAAYAFHIAQGQFLLDGNKRTAVGTALVFLHSNGVTTHFDEMAIYNLLIGIAEKRAGKGDLASYLRKTAAEGA